MSSDGGGGGKVPRQAPPTSTQSGEAGSSHWVWPAAPVNLGLLPQGSGWLRWPYYLEPLTYFGGTAWEATGKQMGGVWGSLKQTLGPLVLTKMQIRRCDVALGDRENARTQGVANGGLGLRQLGSETGLSILNSRCFQAKYACVM